MQFTLLPQLGQNQEVSMANYGTAKNGELQSLYHYDTFICT